MRLLTTTAFAALTMSLPALAAPNTPATTLTIRLISTPGKTVLRDVPPKGLAQGLPSKGDVIRGTSILRNATAQFGRPKGAVVGQDTYVMTFTTPVRVIVSVTATLPDGAIRAKGMSVTTSDRLTVPVIGGTGAYSGARGTSDSKSLAGDRTLNVYRVRVP